MDKRLQRQSRKLSYLLRHGANAEHLSMDAAGWAVVGDVLDKTGLSREELELVVAGNDKSRLELDGERVRCCQGHSLDGTPVTLEALEASWQRWPGSTSLWHGTFRGALEGIRRDGLRARGRTHVHLTLSLESHVGKRSNVDVALEIDPSRLRADGVGIFRSPNGVILCRRVPHAAFVGLRAMTRRARRFEAALTAELGL